MEEIKKVDGVVGGNERPSRVAGQAEWEKMICRIFDVRNLDEEKLTEFLYYYPPPRSVTKSDYETLLFVFEKVSVLIENLNPELVSEYVDAIHAIPEALKGKIDRKLFYRSYVFPFYKKWPKFFSAGELKSLKEYSKSSNN